MNNQTIKLKTFLEELEHLNQNQDTMQIDIKYVIERINDIFDINVKVYSFKGDSLEYEINKYSELDEQMDEIARGLFYDFPDKIQQKLKTKLIEHALKSENINIESMLSFAHQSRKDIVIERITRLVKEEASKNITTSAVITEEYFNSNKFSEMESWDDLFCDLSYWLEVSEYYGNDYGERFTDYTIYVSLINSFQQQGAFSNYLDELSELETDGIIEDAVDTMSEILNVVESEISLNIYTLRVYDYELERDENEIN